MCDTIIIYVCVQPKSDKLSGRTVFGMLLDVLYNCRNRLVEQLLRCVSIMQLRQTHLHWSFIIMCGMGDEWDMTILSFSDARFISPSATYAAMKLEWFFSTYTQLLLRWLLRERLMWMHILIHEVTYWVTTSRPCSHFDNVITAE